MMMIVIVLIADDDVCHSIDKDDDFDDNYDVHKVKWENKYRNLRNLFKKMMPNGAGKIYEWVMYDRLNWYMYAFI